MSKFNHRLDNTIHVVEELGISFDDVTITMTPTLIIVTLDAASLTENGKTRIMAAAQPDFTKPGIFTVSMEASPTGGTLLLNAASGDPLNKVVIELRDWLVPIDVSQVAAS